MEPGFQSVIHDSTLHHHNVGIQHNIVKVIRYCSLRLFQPPQGSWNAIGNNRTRKICYRINCLSGVVRQLTAWRHRTSFLNWKDHFSILKIQAGRAVRMYLSLDLAIWVRRMRWTAITIESDPEDSMLMKPTDDDLMTGRLFCVSCDTLVICVSRRWLINSSDKRHHMPVVYEFRRSWDNSHL